MEKEMSDINSEVAEKDANRGLSLRAVLAGSLLAEKLRANFRFVFFVAFLGVCYIANGYSTEKLYRERVALEKEVRDLRFESITAAADLMFMRKQSEVVKRIKKEGLALEESKEPPVKLFR